MTFPITNLGTRSDAYALVAASDVAWGDLTGVPTSLTLSAGASDQARIPVTVPASATVGRKGHFSLRAISQTGSSVRNIAEVVATVISGPHASVSANPSTLWPPNGKMVPVTVSGVVTSTEFEVDASTVSHAVTDEYGVVQPSGSLHLGTDGGYAFTISLAASRHGDDKDGRQYTIKVSAKDNVGIPGSASTVVTVPHDQGHR